MSRLALATSPPLCGHARVPGDKSISHRAVLLGSIAEGTSRVENFLPAADCLATLDTVQALGIKVEKHSATTLLVHGRGLHGLQEPDDVLHCSRSGTTMRLLAGIVAGQAFLTVLSGAAQLRRRPMARIVEPLRSMGAKVLGRDGGRLPPLAFQGGALNGIDYELPVASAQVKSALLLAGLYAGSPTTLLVPGPARDHTERMLVAMGCDLRTTHHSSPTTVQECRLAPPQRLRAIDVDVPGDFSSAAFLIVAATLIPGSELTLEGIGVNPTRTGLLEILQAMGASVVQQNARTVSGEPVADLTIRPSQLQGTQVGGEQVVRAIDEFPILAVAATQARGQTLVRDAAELRVKETDRIATTVGELRRMGAEIEARPDGFIVQGPTPLRSPELGEGAGATVHSHGDHRLAMALAVAGLVAEGRTVVEDVHCIDDSFPGFQNILNHLGGSIA